MRRILPRIFALVALAGAATAALPAPAHAWWRGNVFLGVGPLYVRPAPVYVPPPAYYVPAPAYRHVWIPAHWTRRGWVPGHWR